MISLIVAMDKKRVIGVDNKLPWHLPADLKRFKELTLGHHIVMGRKTFESIGKPLPGRTTVIITRQREYKAEGCLVVHSLDAALLAAASDSETFILGGGEIFTQALETADKIYITEIDTEVPRGDAYFPELDRTQWKLLERTECSPDDKNRFRYIFLTYLKKT